MANVKKFTMKDTPRLLSHCSRTQQSPGTHIHKDRTDLNYNVAEGLHAGMTDYQFVKARIHQEGVHMMKRDDVKVVCNWAVQYPHDLCHEEYDEEGEPYYVPNDEEDCHKFFQNVYDFFKSKHGEENVVSAYVHMDENVPHMHFSFVPIVKQKDKPGYKVCAKDALHDCYNSSFQVELQDYVSAKLGHEVHMVRAETVDYERNVKELKKKTLNQHVRNLKRDIAELEEEIGRKQKTLHILDTAVEALDSDGPDYQTASANGITMMRDETWTVIKNKLRLLRSFQTEQEELKRQLSELEKENHTRENMELKTEKEELQDENMQLQEKLSLLEAEVQERAMFMEEFRLEDGKTIEQLYQEATENNLETEEERYGN